MVDDKEKIFVELMCRHKEEIWQVCRSFAHRDTHFFEEVRQEVSVAVWKEVRQYGMERLRKKQGEKAWIKRITVNAIFSYGRRFGFPHSVTCIGPEEADELLPPVVREQTAELYELMHFLSPIDKQVLLLRFDGYTHAQIAEQIGVSETAVSTRLCRIVHKLRKIHNK